MSREIPKKTLVVLRSRCDDLDRATSEAVRDTLKRSVKPQEKGWQIVGLQSRRGKEVVIEASNNLEAHKIIADPDLAASGLEAEFLTKRKPTILIRGVPYKVGDGEFSDATFVDALWKQNFPDVPVEAFKRECRPVRRVPWAQNRDTPMDSKRCNVIMELPATMRSRLIERGAVYLSWFRCGVEDYTDVKRCFRCGAIGHLGAQCKRCGPNEKCCRVCSSKEHIDKNCDKRNAPVCLSCTDLKLAHDHRGGSRECEAHRRAVAGLLAVTDYGG